MIDFFFKFFLQFLIIRFFFFQDKKRENHENIREILKMGEGFADDIDFVLEKHWLEADSFANPESSKKTILF